jgi:hypothetical protein
MTDAADFATRLAILGEQYAKRTRNILDDLVVRVEGLGVDIVDEITLVNLHASLHKLAGSGGTFGFSKLSCQARLLEVTVKSWLDDAGIPDSAQWEAWKVSLSALRQTLNVTANSNEAPAKNLALTISQADQIF